MVKWTILIVGLILTWAATAGPEDRLKARQMIQEYVDARGGEAEALLNPAIDVTSRTIICSACHGKDGNSVKAEIPSLAEQNPVYFVEQFLIFQRKERYPELMHHFAQQFDDDGMVALALHFSDLPREVNMPVDAEKGKGGKNIYDTQCAGCHGPQGAGNGEVFASIHKQRPDYLMLSLKRYRDADKDRRSHEMEGVVADWPEETIEALAHYIAGLSGEATEGAN